MLRRSFAWSVVAVVVVTGIVGAASSCVTSSSVVCSDGTLCPDGTSCATVDDVMLCVVPDQLAQCTDQPELAPCGDGGRCYDGVCLTAGCGNGRLDPDEACDDGNNGAGDGCSADCASTEVCGNGVIDLVHGEQCDDGVDRILSHDGCAADCTSETPRWSRFPMPSELDRFPAWAYDAHRDRLVLFGNQDSEARTLEWDGRQWFAPDPDVSPPLRSRHAMAYDASRKRTVLFGGIGFEDTWEWDGATWTQRQPVSSPSARGDHVMVYDARAHRVILFGGRTLTDDIGLGDTWSWDGTSWTPITATPSPGPRFDAAATYDPKRGVVVLFGGSHQSVDSAETWELAGSTWTLRAPATSPAARRMHAMTYDQAAGRVLMFGGSAGIASQTDTWSWDGTSWTQLAIPAFTGTSTNALVATLAPTNTIVMLQDRNDMYRFDGNWVRIEDAVTLAPNRATAAAAVDLVGGRLIVHGGIQTTFISGTTLQWNGVWSQIVGTTPGAMTGGSMAFDSRRREFVLFGGVRPNGDYSSDTWVLAGNTWTLEAPPTGSPIGRDSPVLVHDPVRGVVVMFGGRNNTAGQSLADTWTWDGVAWTERTPATSPPARDQAAASWDPVREEIVLFGGETSTNAALRDTWAWNGTTWTARATTGPGPRFGAGMAWDAARRRTVLFGGASPVTLNDQWEWDGTAWTPLTVATPLRPRANHVMVSSIESAGVLVFGGVQGGAASGELARLAWDGPALDESCVPLDLDGDGLAGCADPDCWRVCHPECPPGATSAITCGPTAARCGDGTCEPTRESCVSCSGDCGTCTASCGDFTCTETPATCPGDCT
ncbi:MAG: hypothetical protein H0T89_31135 [Deltaproteobacteria bacterium]|nr:hypothetical protein [Deltaproteobacteria bacterium]MDQ3298453.1 hypothetical protein [Myxococcota bacterium]